MSSEPRRRLSLRFCLDAVEVARLWIGLVLVGLRLRFVPAPLNRSWLSPGQEPMGRTPGRSSSLRITALLSAMRRASSRLPSGPGNCLRSSLALRSRLSRMGIHARLAYGARRIDGAVQTHAWLEAGDLSIDAFGLSQEFDRFKPDVPPQRKSPTFAPPPSVQLH